jgi:ATP-binding cassette subfamily B protein
MADKLSKKRIKLFSATFPIVKSVLLNSKYILISLIFISILLGFVPTIKSLLESAIVNDIGEEISKNQNGIKVDIKYIFTSEFGQFKGIPSDDSDWSVKLTYTLFKKVNLFFALIYYVIISLCAFSIEAISNLLSLSINRQLFSRLRGEGFIKGLSIDPRRLSSLPNVPGQYANSIQQGATNIAKTYNFILQASQYIFSLVTTLILVASKNSIFAISCLIIVLIQSLLSFYQAKKLDHQRQQLDLKRNDLMARTDDILGKREIILAYEQQEYYKKKLDNYTSEYTKLSQDIDIKENIFDIISRMIMDYGKIAILVIGLFIVVFVSRETDGINNIGDVYFFISIYARLLGPFSGLLNGYDNIRRSEATSITYLELISKKEINISSQDQALSPCNQYTSDIAIRFSNVWFSYDFENNIDKEESEKTYEWALRNCSFYVPRNCTTLIVGRSGSGKSTISRILLGFCPNTRGSVYINDRLLNNWNTYELRAMMSYVSQGDHIVDDSIRENLLWGNNKVTKSDIQLMQTLKEVGIINEKVGERILDDPARKLSIGQQQRLSFARMMLDDSAFIILDEPFSGVDAFTIRDLQPCLKKLFNDKEKTFIMFSHRLPFSSFARHIIVLGDDGSIAEEGDPKKLLERKGIFYELYNTAKTEFPY